VHVGPRHELREHAGGLLEQSAPEIGFGRAEARRHARQVPDRIDRDLDHGQAAIVVDMASVRLEPAQADRVPHLDEVEPGAGDRDGRTDVLAFLDFGLEGLGREMAPRIERDDARRLRPLRERPYGRHWVRIGEIGPADRIERARRDRKRAIKGIRAAMAADDIAMLRPGHRADDRPAFAGVRSAPANRKAQFAARLRMGGEANMVDAVGGHFAVSGKAARRPAGRFLVRIAR